jgi:sugar lactone lactonase YvrE
MRPTYSFPLLAMLALVALAPTASSAEKVTLAEGLNNPESAVVGADGRIYVTITGKPNVDDGEVVAIEDGKARVIAKGMSDPRGIARKGDTLIVADLTKVWKIDASGTASVLADTDAFPVKPRFLNDVEVAANGDVFVSDSGTFTGNGGVFRITTAGAVSTVIDAKSAPALKGPNGLLNDGADHLLVGDVASGKLYRAKLADGSVEELAAGLGGADGIARDAKDRIYVGDVRGGRVFRMDGSGGKPAILAEGFKSAADIAIDGQGRVLVPDSRAGTLTAIVIDD